MEGNVKVNPAEVQDTLRDFYEELQTVENSNFLKDTLAVHGQIEDVSAQE